MSTVSRKNQRVERTRAGGEWTEARYWQFIRSALRQASRRWPPIARHALESARRPYVGPNHRQKWEFCCEVCREHYKRTEVQVDHIIPVGSLKSFDDLPGFVQRLFCEEEGLRIVCKRCHSERHKS